MENILVAKIGGSTLGSHDTTLDDVAELQRRGIPCVVVHGGGALISDWLKCMDVPTRFERGLRVTDAGGLKVVVAVLAGLVNKELVAALGARGVNAFGLSGVDGAVLRSRVSDPALGFVGDIAEVDAAPILRLLGDRAVPVIAPIAAEWAGSAATGRLLNTNADTTAGAVAAALSARWLVFLTDVPGVMLDGTVLSELPSERAAELVKSGVIAGGMIPKVEACLGAAPGGTRSVIVDGREEHALLGILDDAPGGTAVG